MSYGVTKEKTKSRLSDDCFSTIHRTLDAKFKMCDVDVVEFRGYFGGVCTPVAFMDVKFITPSIRNNQITDYMVEQTTYDDKKTGRNALSCYQTIANTFNAPFLVYFYRPKTDLYIALSLNNIGDEVIMEISDSQLGILRNDTLEISINGISEKRYSVRGKYSDLNEFIRILRRGR